MTMSSFKGKIRKPDITAVHLLPIHQEDHGDAPMTIEDKCDLIAELSESILEEPSNAFSALSGDSNEHGPSKAPSRIKTLMDIANLEKPGTDVFTSRLAIISLVTIFADIIPLNRIRLPTASEMSVRVSKETKALWDYDRNLLQNYQLYLKLLERTWDNRSAGDPLGVTCILAMCELFKKAPHFNFRSNILAVITRQMNNSSLEVSEACCGAVEYVFANDAQGEIALEAARLVCKIIRDRKFKVSPRVLKTFASLPLRVHVDEAQAAKLAAVANAKKRKRGNQEQADIEAELREGEGRVDKILLARSQSDTLQAVTITYFQILKSDSVANVAALLPTALEGLAKIAHLINMDTVLDLLEVLKSMLKKVDVMPLDASLSCILCAFSTLQGPGRELKIDQKEYITPLYSQLSRLTSEETELALQCLSAAFLKRREYSVIRLASFAKQLSTVALHSAPSTAAPILAFLRQLFHRYQSLEQLLENEQDVITEGQYDPTVEDPEHANPFATSVWELSTLVFHINPMVASQATKAASQTLIQLPAEAPHKIRSEMCHDFYISAKRVKKKHPLTPRDGNQQARFIAPNTTANLHLSKFG